MSRQHSFVLIGLLVTACVSGCTKTMLRVTLLPSDVRMERVVIDGQEFLSPQGPYDKEITFEEGVTERRVPIDVTSRGGVEYSTTCLVSKGQDPSPQKTIAMPGRVDLKVMSKTASQCAVTIDGEEVSESSGNYVKHVSTDGQPNKSIAVSAQDLTSNYIDTRTITVAAGKPQQAKLDLNVTAKFAADSQSITYREDITFDASQSTPNGSLVNYDWDFGDGVTKQSDQPRVTHKYGFDSETGFKDAYTVTLKVTAKNGETASFTETVTVKPSDKSFVVDLNIYPQKATYEPGETVQLKLTALDPAFARDVERVALSWGDGTTTTVTNGGHSLAWLCNDDTCKPLVVTHVYEKAGRFTPQLTYQSQKRGLMESRPADIRTPGSARAVIVSPAYLSDEELIDKAWEDFYSKFDHLLEKNAKIKEKKVALTSMKDANFETAEPEFLQVIRRLTKMLVKENYFVLEKNSQVLARLAPEAIVDVTPELEGDGIGSQASNQPTYKNYLDYGLATKHLGANQPIIYSIKIEGTDDRLIQYDRASEDASSETKAITAGFSEPDLSIQEGRSSASAWARNLPVLMARFKTADILIALEELEEPHVVSQPDYYDEELNAEMVKRTAFVKLHVRLLERSGKILRAVDITGEYSELATNVMDTSASDDTQSSDSETVVSPERRRGGSS